LATEFLDLNTIVTVDLGDVTRQRVPRPEMFSTLCAGMGNAFNVLSLDVVPHIPHTLAVGFATNLAGVLPLSYFFNHGVDCFVKLIISYVGLYKRFCRDQGIL